MRAWLVSVVSKSAIDKRRNKRKTVSQSCCENRIEMKGEISPELNWFLNSCLSFALF